MLVNCGGVLAGSVQFSMERFLSKRSCLVKQCSFIRQFKAIYKFNSPKKFLERLKRERERELELYKSRIITIPNILTISRLTLSPLFPWLIMSGHTKCAFGLLAYCGASDILDGWIARRFNQKSVLGSILDPVADKITVLIFSASLLVMGHLPYYLGALIISKDALMLISGIILRYRSLLRDSVPLNRFFDPKVASIEIKPLLLSKINTILQFITLGACLSPIDLAISLMKTLHITTFVSTALTALIHCFQYRKVVKNIRS